MVLSGPIQSVLPRNCGSCTRTHVERAVSVFLPAFEDRDDVLTGVVADLTNLLPSWRSPPIDFITAAFDDAYIKPRIFFMMRPDPRVNRFTILLTRRTFSPLA